MVLDGSGDEWPTAADQQVTRQAGHPTSRWPDQQVTRPAGHQASSAATPSSTGTARIVVSSTTSRANGSPCSYRVAKL